MQFRYFFLPNGEYESVHYDVVEVREDNSLTFQQDGRHLMVTLIVNRHLLKYDEGDDPSVVPAADGAVEIDEVAYMEAVTARDDARKREFEAAMAKTEAMSSRLRQLLDSPSKKD